MKLIYNCDAALFVEGETPMKFGICSADKKMKELGADYSELCAWAVSAMGKKEYSSLVKSVNAGEIVTYSCNGLLPAEVRVTGDVDKVLVRDYVDKTLYRLKELGIGMIVFGSSAAKNVPDAFPMEKAWEQLFEFGYLLSDVAEKNGQTVAVEPLNYTEVNIVNTVEDGAYYVNTVNRSNFKLLADFYHVDQNKEDLSVLSKYKDMLVHIHIAGLKRTVPLTDEDKAYVKSRIQLLKDIGYQGNVSFEGGISSDFEGVSEMLSLFKSL